MVTPFVFGGKTAYLEAAARKRGRPELARAAGRQPALIDLANLCAQASRADAEHVETILAKAAEFREQLAVAFRAADAMIVGVRAARLASTQRPARGTNS